MNKLIPVVYDADSPVGFFGVMQLRQPTRISPLDAVSG